MTMNPSALKRFLFILAASALLPLQWSCTSKSFTAVPVASTTTFTLTGPLVIGVITNASGSDSAIAEVANTNASPVTNAAVTLTYTGTTGVALSYYASGSYPVTYSGGITEVSCAAYEASLSTPFTVGSPVTMTTVIGSNTYTSSVVAVGNVGFTSSGSTASVTWTGGGNEDLIEVEETISPYTYKIYGPGTLASPYSVSLIAPAGYNENAIVASINNLTTSFTAGASSYSFLESLSGASTFY